MFTAAFLKATLERALKTAAQSAILVIGADQFNALAFDWNNLAGFAAGGFALSVLTSIGTGALTDGNPSVGDAEVVAE
jgi:hypothetical protein